MVEDAPLQLVEQRRGLEPELLAQPAACVGQSRQGLRLTAAAVERDGLRRAQALPSRMSLDQRLDIRERLPRAAEGEQRVGAILERIEARTLAALGEGRELGRLQSEQRPPPPECERGVERRQGGRVVAALPRASRALDVRREALQVERRGGQHDAVARAAADDHLPVRVAHGILVLEQPAQLGDEPVECRDGRLRRLLAPERVDQTVAGRRPAGLDQEQGQEQRPLAAAERQRTTVAPDGERAQHIELEAPHRPRDSTAP